MVGVLAVLDAFCALSGLQVNNTKLKLFAAGMSRLVLDDIHFTIKFSIFQSPIRYLGFSLVSKQLSIKDCKVLIDKIITRIKHWTSRFLSNAGPLQFIQSVILAWKIIGTGSFYYLRLC